MRDIFGLKREPALEVGKREAGKRCFPAALFIAVLLFGVSGCEFISDFLGLNPGDLPESNEVAFKVTFNGNGGTWLVGG
ncbi:MAG: hypothetical protein LBG27_07710, partial [Spirochaetaceae bacterium]|nr:hypothetical protein [Spirochaetaceae bacterium]